MSAVGDEAAPEVQEEMLGSAPQEEEISNGYALRRIYGWCEEDRLIREKREEEDAIREESWQRQVERDDKTHNRQLEELLDIRNKNAIRLAGINASKAERAAATKLKKQVDAVISTNNLNDTPAIRAEIANGLTLYGLKDYMSGLKSGEIRFANTGIAVQQDNPDTTIPTPEAY